MAHGAGVGGRPVARGGGSGSPAAACWSCSGSSWSRSGSPSAARPEPRWRPPTPAPYPAGYGYQQPYGFPQQPAPQPAPTPRRRPRRPQRSQRPRRDHRRAGTPTPTERPGGQRYWDGSSWTDAHRLRRRRNFTRRPTRRVTLRGPSAHVQLRRVPPPAQWARSLTRAAPGHADAGCCASSPRVVLVLAAAAAWIAWTGLRARDELTEARVRHRPAARSPGLRRPGHRGRPVLDDAQVARGERPQPHLRPGLARGRLGPAAGSYARPITPGHRGGRRRRHDRAAAAGGRRRPGSTPAPSCTARASTWPRWRRRCPRCSGRGPRWTRSTPGWTASARRGARPGRRRGDVAAAPDERPLQRPDRGGDGGADPPADARRPATRHYLVVFQNDAEARGTGGLVGAYALVQASAGHVTVQGWAPTPTCARPPPRCSTSAPDYRALFGADPGLWANTNLSANFPYAARAAAAAVAAAARSAARRGDRRGPGGAGLPARRDRAGDDARRHAAHRLRDRRADHAAGVRPLPVARADRAAQAVPAVRRRGRPGQGPRRRVGRAADAAGAGPAAGERRLLVYSAHAAEQALIAGTAVAGVVDDSPGPYAGVAIDNASGSKVDYYTKASLSYVRGCAQGGAASVAATITLTLTDQAPAERAAGVRRLPARPRPADVGGRTRRATARSWTGSWSTSRPAPRWSSATLDGRPTVVSPGVDGAGAGPAGGRRAGRARGRPDPGAVPAGRRAGTGRPGAAAHLGLPAGPDAEHYGHRLHLPITPQGTRSRVARPDLPTWGVVRCATVTSPRWRPSVASAVLGAGMVLMGPAAQAAPRCTRPAHPRSR